MTPSKRKRKTPWARRIVSTLVLLALLVGLVFLVFKAVVWVGDYFKSEHQKNTELTTLQPAVYEACEEKDISISLTPSVTTITQGQGTDIVMSLENTGADACTMTPGDISVSALLGGDSVWTPIACSSTLSELPLLLAPNQPWSQTLSWDGKAYVNCEAVTTGEEATAVNAAKGTYELRYSAFGGESKIGANLTIE